MAGELFSKFKLLKVLDLEDAALEHFPKEVVKLFLLRYLSLRNTKIKSVPQSIKKLRNLIILDLRQNFIIMLPEEIRELHKLLYLLVSFQDRDKNHAAVGAEVSPGIGHLELLQMLSLIKANNKMGSIVEELGKLTELRKLGITELKKEDGKELCASIEKMEHLTSLYVKSASVDENLDLNYVDMFPQMIKNIFLGGRLHNIPRWIPSLSGLCKIELKWSKLENSLLEALRDLPSLEELYLHDAYSGEVLEFGAEWFVDLRILVIEQCSSLKKVAIPEPAMPKL